MLEEEFLRQEDEAELPLLPLRDIVVFPGMVAPLFVGREKSIRSVEYALQHDKMIMLSAQKAARNEDPTEDDIFTVGCISRIVQVFRMPDGTVKIMVEGETKARIVSYVSREPMFIVNAKPIPRAELEAGSGLKLEAMARGVRSLFSQYIEDGNRMPEGVTPSISETTDPETLVDLIMGHLGLPTSDRQKLLEETDPAKRLEDVLAYLETEIEILKIEKRVKGRVKKQMDKTQKEYYLNEQMKAIQKELGRSDVKSEVDELKEKVRKAKMPAEVEAKVLKEIQRLEQMPPMSAEGTVVRNYVDWLVELPWTKRTKEKIDVKAAQKILDEDHHGLEKVKERILDYLAVKKLSKSNRGPILCLVGPPGVGKTSLGRSIARSLGRKFARVSLGGVRDEAEIRGHRRTYVGALPGRIMQSMKKAGTVNPVIMLDEIDKMSMDFRGDPSSALLEVLDPEQNKAFSDHFIELDYDLSEVMFITTANVLHTIPTPLLDRMEVLHMSGYTEEEKVDIAESFLVPKQLKEHGLGANDLHFPSQVMSALIREYTREAGVRNLERVIAEICRKAARMVVEGKKYNRSLKASDMVKYLGPPKYRIEMAESHNEVGLALGLAWTETGGDIMRIEVSVVPGKGKLMLTGKLGEVMRESAHAALTYIRSRAERFSLPRGFYAKNDIHIHVPEGAIPKDGPSAGITMASAMVSAFCRVPVRHDVAMTGEVTLRGKVLPIGGLKEKTLAAHRAGIKEIVIPKNNETDLEKLPPNVRKEMNFILADSMDDVLNAVMTEGVFAGVRKKVRTAKKGTGERLRPSAGIN